MDTLRTYLNSLPPAEQAAFACRAGTTIGYLRKALSVQPKLDGALVKQLWEESRGTVLRSDLRPDIWTPAEDAAAQASGEFGPAPAGKVADAA